MSNQPPRGKGSRASLVTILVALAIAAIYFANSGALALLLPDLYPSTSDPAAVATATTVAATVTADFLAGTPETFLTTPTPVPLAASVETGPAVAAEAPASAVTRRPAQEPTAEPTKVPTEEPTEAPTATETTAPTRTPTRAPTPRPTIPARINGLPTITLDELPPEALDTIDLIDSGGPFPFDKDGSIFQNREGLLPGERRGFYREYTVITPGEDDRGARRIVAGEDGTLYYTDDHYDSFSVIVRDE